ncbi:mRNA methyltransferase [Kockovaella imperatae]|uniref:mRNA m(6)A methyltransferase n=1 Tax=Kockovaella imperatae TaxID=4999 RepID=A0A1Y1UM81_9TREE|nr:mRNA methyltransferase [Kockovaella imperatae]ORX38604.1 mRNA methyltransferase [Kockovaella imperatae]
MEAESNPGNHAVAELRSLMSRETAKAKLRRLATCQGQQIQFNPICPSTTLTQCKSVRLNCTKAHYEPIIRPWTDISLGYCSYLNLCYGEPMFTKNPSLGDGSAPRGGTKECRYMHFHVVPSDREQTEVTSTPYNAPLPLAVRRRLLADQSGDLTEAALRAQWINCDIRSFDYSVLGQFQVIVADPPWDIHMSLPYGTMTDDEMRRMPLSSLQPDWGILCLWVTGRAMELGRELFSVWGYKRVDELVWVKINQLQRLIRTGRTGHWLNHTCEHLLIAVKLPSDHPRDAPIPWDTDHRLRALRRGIDTDVVVAEVRETSRKPDEVYGVIERLAPHGRKLELFGRRHNIRPGWLTLGNQLGDTTVTEQDLHDRLRDKYPQLPIILAD